MFIHKPIRSVEDWLKYAPPKKGILQWKDKHSAKELAKSWFRKESACPPEEMRQILEDFFRTTIVFHEAEPECVIKLDDFAGEHRNCDLVVLCDVGSKHMVVNLEAKAQEPFGDVIGEYYDRMIGTESNIPERNRGDQKTGSVSKVPERIQELSRALFGRTPDEAIRKLRYQLLHAAAATLIEAKERKAEIGLFLVHEFREKGPITKKVKQNAADWENFVHTFPELTTARIGENQFLGPVVASGGKHVPNSVPLYLGKLVTELE